MRVHIAVLLLMFSVSSSLWAQGGETADARFKELEDRIKALESQVQSLQAALTASGAPAPAQPAAQETATVPVTVPAPSAAAAPGALQGTPVSLPVYGGAASATKVLNPDISVIGNFIGLAGRNPLEAFPSLSLRESEFGFQAIVDPYARADFFVSIGEEGAEIEEGFITFPALPGGFTLKAGKMRANFGKINALHNHVLPWIDRPLITFNLLGGDPAESDAGIKDAGLSVSRIIPGFAGLFIEATGEVYRGSSGSCELFGQSSCLFSATRRSDVSTIDHLRIYRDISESTNLEVGGSYARGYNEINRETQLFITPEGDVAFTTARDLHGKNFITQLFGIDATLRWKPLRRAIYHSFLARAEFDWSRRDDIQGGITPGFPLIVFGSPLGSSNICLDGRNGGGCFRSGDLRTTLKAHGFYTSADYQLGRRWFVGGRFDWSQRGRDPNAHDSAESLILTYWPSEFSQVRGQIRRTNYAEGIVANELLFQFQFSLGAHGAHPF